MLIDTFSLKTHRRRSSRMYYAKSEAWVVYAMKSPLKTTFDWLYDLGFTFMSYIVARLD